MNAPSLSVLMTVYNGGAYLPPAIASVLADPAPLELVVVDNVSIDGSREFLRSLSDPRVRLIENQTNLGQTGALRCGLDACRAPVVARLDADDLVEPGRFARQLAAFAADPDLVLVGGQAVRIDGTDRPLSRTALPTDADEIAAVMCVANPFVHSAVAFRREAALAAGGYPADFVVAQDYALWSALLRRGGRLVNQPELACRLRIHPGQVTASAQGSREEPEALRITALNQAWAMDLPEPDEVAARAIHDLWRGRTGAAATDAALQRLFTAPRLKRRGCARLALTLAAAPGRDRGIRRLSLLGRAFLGHPVGVAAALWDWAAAGCLAA